MGFNGLGHDQHFTVSPGEPITFIVHWGDSSIPGYGEDRGAQYIAGNPIWEPPNGAGGILDVIMQRKDVQGTPYGPAVRYWVTLRNSGPRAVWVDLQGGGF